MTEENNDQRDDEHAIEEAQASNSVTESDQLPAQVQSTSVSPGGYSSPSDGNLNPDNDKKEKGQSRVTVKPESLTVRVSQSAALSATVQGDNAELLWLTTNSAIVKVTDLGATGIVLGVTPGNATVTVIIKGEGDKSTAEVSVS